MEEEKAEIASDINVEEGKELEYLRQEEKVETKEPPKEEPKVEAKEESKEEEKPKFVPLEALHEERMKRKELKERLEKQEQRFQEFLQKVSPRDEPKEPVFENETDRLRYEQQQLAKSVQEQQRFVDEQRRAAHENQRVQSVINVYQTKAEQYAKQNPAFTEAYRFLLESRKNEYLAVGYTPDQVAQLLANDELAIVHKAMEDEADPAERIFNIAKARGFTQKPKAAEKIENIEKGMNKSKTLSSVSGSSPKTLTLEMLSEMSEDEFSKLSYDDIRRIAGG